VSAPDTQSVTEYPPVVIVNENDEVVGEAALADARATGLIYRVVFVVARDSAGRILLQKRSQHMRLYPGCWDVSAAGHVDGGRTYEQAAALELAEELGVHDAELKEIAHYYADDPLWGGVQARRFAKIFEIKLDALPTRLGRAEVSKVRWFTKEELAELAAREPDKMAEGLRYAAPYLLNMP